MSVTEIPRYRITAEMATGRLSVTRVARASAVVLAMKWEKLGYTDVAISDPEGTRYLLSAFRRRFVTPLGDSSLGHSNVTQQPSVREPKVLSERSDP